MRPALCHKSRVAPPGYSGHYTDKVSKGYPYPRNQRTKDTWSDAGEVTDYAAAAQESRKGDKAVAGYTGLIPGKETDPVVGKTWKLMTLDAVVGQHEAIDDSIKVFDPA